MPQRLALDNARYDKSKADHQSVELNTDSATMAISWLVTHGCRNIELNKYIHHLNWPLLDTPKMRHPAHNGRPGT